MPVSDELTEIKWAEYPQRSCRQVQQSGDGFTDHSCSLPELHPGPCCPKTLPAAILRRQTWEAANPGWDKISRDPDPFADFTKIPGVV